MSKKQITTAAYLAGVTTLAVTMPVMAETRTFSVSDFTDVTIERGVDVELTAGEDFSVTAEASRDHMLNRLKIKQSGDRLLISRDKSWRDWSMLTRGYDAQVNVTLPVLRRLDARSGADVEVQGPFDDLLDISASSGAEVEGHGIQSETLEVEASSGSSVELSGLKAGQVELSASSGSDIDVTGQCDDVQASASSGADVDAKGLVCTTGELEASSGADVSARVDETVTAKASSGGSIDIAGSPAQIEKGTSSGGSVDVN